MTRYRFVLVDPVETQAYPLYGLLPIPLTLFTQLLLTLALALLVAVGFAVRNDMLLPGLQAATSVHPTNKSRPANGRTALRRAQPAPSGPVSATTLLAAQQQASSSSASTTPSKTQAGPACTKYKGLRNTGNTCFFNSTLQAISALPMFQQYLCTLVDQAEQSDTPTPVIDSLLDLVQELAAPGERNAAIHPTQLVRALQGLPSSSLRSLVGAHQQQDAHELFALLNEAVDAEAKSVYSDRDAELDLHHAGLRTLMAPSLPWTGKAVHAHPPCPHPPPSFLHAIAPSLQTAPSFPQPRPSTNAVTTLMSPFDALLAQRTTCLDCGYCEAIRHFSTSELSLSVPALNIATPTSQRTGTSACSLTECLALWSELEQVDWSCWNCSLRNTLSAVRADLAIKTPASSFNGASKHNPNSTGPMSAAKKKRLAHLRSRESKLVRILSSGLSEDEVTHEHADPSSALFGVLNGVTLTKTVSRLSTKQIMVSRPPRILALHLNRSSYSASAWAPTKNNRHVLFNDLLDLEPITLHGSISTDGRTAMNIPVHDTARTGAKYRLAAIVVHFGSHSFGHYIAYKRVTLSNASDLWLRISDESVSVVDFHQVRSENPFMLFYEQIAQQSDIVSTVNAAAQRVRPRTLHRWHPPSSPSPGSPPPPS